jgi:hypothetical protein
MRNFLDGLPHPAAKSLVIGLEKDANFAISAGNRKYDEIEVPPRLNTLIAEYDGENQCFNLMYRETFQMERIAYGVLDHFKNRVDFLYKDHANFCRMK